jgi:aspartate/methionine/tyrosine aminotransferase
MALLVIIIFYFILKKLTPFCFGDLDLERRRNLLSEVLEEVGLKPTIPDGSYFIMADTSVCKIPAEFQDRRRDFNFCRWLTSKVGVAAIPPSAFYDPANEHLPANYARFCFIKTDEMLNEAAKRLRNHFLQK